MWLFAGILAVPLIEIALFVTIGGWLGLWLTLAIVIGTAVAGVLVLRIQGLQAMDGLRRAAGLRRNPISQMADSAIVALAGVLLVLPGFLTDTIGLLLLVPPLRRLLVQLVASRVHVHPVAPDPHRRGPDVIDGEFFEIGDDQINDRRPGGTRH